MIWEDNFHLRNCDTNINYFKDSSVGASQRRHNTFFQLSDLLLRSNLSIFCFSFRLCKTHDVQNPIRCQSPRRRFLMEWLPQEEVLRYCSSIGRMNARSPELIFDMSRLAIQRRQIGLIRCSFLLDHYNAEIAPKYSAIARKAQLKIKKVDHLPSLHWSQKPSFLKKQNL